MKLLVTGFEPFGGETINASWEAVRALPCQIDNWEVTALCLPVEYGRAAELALHTAREMQADAILCVGQAAGRSEITPEQVGINLRYGRIPDNAGFQPLDEPAAADGDAAYFSTLPARRMAEAITAAGVAAKLSYSAGAYVCNDLLYSLLHAFKGTSVRVGFIHVPITPAQATPNQPFMETSVCESGLIAAIKAM